MKKIFKAYVGITVLSVAFISGCNSNDYSQDKAIADKNDSPAVVNAVPGVTNSAPVVIDSPLTVSTVKPNPALKGKKGKVSSVMMTVANKKVSSMDIDKEGYYQDVEVLPGFPGGQKALDKFINDNVEYPSTAIDNGIEGTVDVIFAVDENGKIYTPQATNSKIGYGVEEEALRVIAKMPTWTPGRIKGKNVKTHYTLPISFQLSE